MKRLSYIFTFFVVFLTIQPTVALINETPETSCCGSSSCGNEDEDSTPDSKHDKGDCKDQNCNPFQACGSCLGFTVINGFYQIKTTIVQKSSPVFFTENFISQFSPDVWQPPKIS